MKKSHIILISIVGITIFAFGLRLIGLSFGLPDVLLEDEEFFVVPALRVAEGNLNPQWFGAPAQPLIYGLAFVFRLSSVIINWLADTTVPVTMQYDTHMVLMHSIGRILPALVGVGVVLLLFCIGKRWSTRAGIASSLLGATSFYFIEHSHIIRPDLLQSFFLLGACLFVWRILKKPHAMSGYIWTGIFFGFAISTKYPSLFFLAPLFVLVMIQIRSKQFVFRKWLVGMVATLGALFASGPYLFLSADEALLDIGKEASSSHGGHDGFGFLGNLWWYASDVLNWQIGTFFYLAALGAVVFIVVGFFKKETSLKHTYFFLIAVTAVSYLVLMSVHPLHWERWMIPVTACGFIFAGIAVDWVLSQKKSMMPVVLLLLVLASIAPIFRTVRTLHSFLIPHTQQETQAWIQEHISGSEKILREPHTPELPGMNAEKIPNLSVKSYATYCKEGVSYALISGGVYGVIQAESEKQNSDSYFVRAMKTYTNLFAQSSLVRQWGEEGAAEKLLYASDWTVVGSMRIDLQRGHYQRFYQLDCAIDE